MVEEEKGEVYARTAGARTATAKKAEIAAYQRRLMAATIHRHLQEIGNTRMSRSRGPQCPCGPNVPALYCKYNHSLSIFLFVQKSKRFNNSFPNA